MKWPAGLRVYQEMLNVAHSLFQPNSAEILPARKPSSISLADLPLIVSAAINAAVPPLPSFRLSAES
jgi:hypothetical protein